ncbi:hypothetical protein BDV33DRAFT_185321 [Aspergillus novoparasiticus]|uniref:Uncharacterized protein n=1 Tax=Aspergillus novoparasiticus TaxID=986946 RepID=A0A5N6E6F9_9EURO|nr:hypothetical protein BDV33DRAFT_185321 [Aspergillus novoparasiticus]
MSLPGNLTSSELVDRLEAERKEFTEEYLPLTNKQLRGVQKCSHLVGNRDTILRNTPKKRARDILSHLWQHSKEVYFLCALATHPTALGTLKSPDYLRVVLRWWSKVDHPKGLAETVERHKEVLPYRKTNGPPYRTNLRDTDLINFLQTYSGEQRSLAIRITDDENELPAIEISREMCQELIMFAMESTRTRLMISEQDQDRG